MYMMLKHLHLTAIAISVVLFILRFIWLMRESPQLQKKWVKILPHVVDTVLLASALGLCMVISQYPFVNGWVTEKVIGLVCYILLGLVAFKWARNNAMRLVGFFGALSWLVFTAKVAITKQPLLFS
ncbi:SirB2 family protein [Aestuariibacter salexigens]|uniref:SirB2 family protein n=1 Tax=Aestuariibacter salexigens TaxID=226010 RepID=UPI0003FB28BC|nr:SirB2 family protein [Aestuariibacter salexigens]